MVLCDEDQCFRCFSAGSGSVAVEREIETGFGKAWITNRIVGTLRDEGYGGDRSGRSLNRDFESVR